MKYKNANNADTNGNDENDINCRTQSSYSGNFLSFS